MKIENSICGRESVTANKVREMFSSFDGPLKACDV